MKSRKATYLSQATANESDTQIDKERAHPEEARVISSFEFGSRGFRVKADG